MTPSEITAPVLEPVSLNEAKQHIRVTADDEDTLINQLIISARQRAEVYMKRAILTQTLEIYSDAFESYIDLPFSPVQSVVSIKYIDTDGGEQTLDAAEYSLSNKRTPAVVVEAYGKTWPTTRDQLDAVTVQYVAGWLNPASVPGPIKSAILLMVGDMYRNREDVSPEENYQLPNSADNLLYPYRILSL